MAKRTRGYLVMKIAGQKTVREREYEHEECEGCGSRDKPVFTYLGQDGEPIVCSKPCFERALVKRFGGVRPPSRTQVRELARAKRDREARRQGHGADATVVPLQERRRQAG